MSNTIEYYLPEKVIKLTVKYLVKQELTYNLDNELIKVKVKDCYINDDIILETMLFPDYELKAVFDYSKFRSCWYQRTFEVGFDDNGSGILQSINFESTPVLKDVIIGAVGVASSIVKLFAGAFLAAPATEAEILQVETRERIITETYIIRTGEMASNSYSYTLPKPDVGDPNIKVPVIEILIKPDKPLKDYAEPKNRISEEKIFYRELILSNIKVIIRDNGFIKQQIPIDDYSYFPQFGDIKSLDITVGNIFNKSASVINFSPSTGGLQKFTLTNESKIKDALEGADNVLSTINTLKQDIEKKKNDEIEEKKKKKEAKLKEIKESLRIESNKEIESLKREKEILELKKQISELKKPS